MFKKSHLKIITLILPLLLLPIFFGFNDYYILLATLVVFYATIATTWNIIGGMAGQTDLAAASYLGLGAFTCGTLIIRWNIPFWIGMPLGGLVAVAFAIAIGYPSFRFGLREVWYALASIASVVVLGAFFHIWENVGGPIERYLPHYDFSLLYMRFDTYIPFFYLITAFLVFAFYINYRIERSKMGYYLRAIAEDEIAAAALGIDVRMCKLKALMIYAFFTGAMGAFYANMLGFIHFTFFDTFFSIIIVVLGIVGGLGVIYGPAVAAFLLIGAREIIRVQFGIVGGMPWIVYGLILILVILFKPEGIGKVFKDAYEKIIRILFPP